MIVVEGSRRSRSSSCWNDKTRTRFDKKDATYLKKRGDCRMVVVLHSTTTRVISREICPRRKCMSCVPKKRAVLARPACLSPAHCHDAICWQPGSSTNTRFIWGSCLLARDGSGNRMNCGHRARQRSVLGTCWLSLRGV